MSYEKTEFGRTKSGEMTWLYTFRNSSGMQMKVSNFGAVLVSVLVKDAKGEERDVVLGYDDVSGYEADTFSYGAVIGRNANRIGGASVVIGGKTYELAKNNNGNNLHSGPDFYRLRVWEVDEVSDDSVRFALFSPHMDQGYPGNLNVYVTYTLTENNEVCLAYRAVPDEDTIVNMTNHSYFNLNGEGSGSVLGHEVWIDADSYTAADAQSIPTGEIVPVEGTPMDFRAPKEIGERIGSDYAAIVSGQGYDHNYVLNGSGLREAASMTSRESGICMTVSTDLPGMQFYTGNFLKGQPGKGGHIYSRRDAACFETQLFPDAIHHANFRSPICKKGEAYTAKTVYRFAIA